MNKKAWLLVVEVSIAIVIMFSFLFLTISKQPKQQEININEELDFVVKQAIENQSIRTNLLDNNFAQAESELIKKINQKFDLSFADTPGKKDIYATKFFLWDDDLKIVKNFTVYMWVRDQNV